MAKFMYKCRLCGKEYSNSSTGDQYAFQHLLNAIDGKPAHPQAPTMIEHHYCDTSRKGIADFIGYIQDEPDKG